MKIPDKGTLPGIDAKNRYMVIRRGKRRTDERSSIRLRQGENPMKTIIVGGGWAGCAAAISARKQGADVILVERTDMLLGTGLVGGIMRNNGRFTATEEMIAMGGGELFQVTDEHSPYRNIEFPGHRHASLYSVATIEPAVRKLLQKFGVEVLTSTRIEDVEMSGGSIKAAVGKREKEGIRLEGEVFIDTTGTAGPMPNCIKYGNGCAMCVLRCPSFGGRVSFAEKAGVKEMTGKKGDQIGAMSGSCKLLLESLSPEINAALREKGVAVIPIPAAKRVSGKNAIKACQQYAGSAFEENIILLNTGHAKLMSPFYPLDTLREIPGFENARFEDPYTGGRGNSVRYFNMSPRNDALQVDGVENLFCAGEKAGLLVGHTEAICTGTLAGHNAAKHLGKEKPIIFPTSLAVGEAIRFVRLQMGTEEGMGLKYTFSGSVFFDRMNQLDLYSTDVRKIERRVEAAGMTGIFAKRK
jgi:hypothetical protein